MPRRRAQKTRRAADTMIILYSICAYNTIQTHHRASLTEASTAHQHNSLPPSSFQIDPPPSLALIFLFLLLLFTLSSFRSLSPSLPRSLRQP